MLADWLTLDLILHNPIVVVVVVAGPHREAELEAKVSQLKGMGFEEVSLYHVYLRKVNNSESKVTLVRA